MDKLLNSPSWLLALISGILVGLSYPPLHLGFLMWVGLIPLIHVLLNETPKQSAKLAFLSSITANFISLYWIGLNSGAGFFPVFASLVGAVLYLGLFWSLFGYAVTYSEKKYSKGIFVIPFSWVAMEFIRSLGPLGFPWINLAITQTNYLPLIQIADLFGSYGISFWILLINIGFYLILIRNQKLKYLIITSVIFLLMIGYGLIRINSIEEPKSNIVTIAVTQPNINPDEKWDPDAREQIFESMHSLLDSALMLKPDLILWPESAVPALLRISNFRRSAISKKLIEFNTPLLSGTVDRIINEDREKVYYNSSIYIKPDGTIQMYHKKHLVPFAEYIPLSETFPSLKKLNFGQGNFTAGTEYTLFKLDSIQFSNIICYESSNPQVLRGFVKNGAQFITIEANDGWLGKSSGPYQHFELAKIRAVENRIPIVRCANTGISGVISPKGIVKQKIPLGKKVVFKANIIPSQGLTFYTKYGDIFALFCVVISILIFSISCIKKQK